MKTETEKADDGRSLKRLVLRLWPFVLRSTLERSYYDASFYVSRCSALAAAQRKMRDPERTIVCDILANGKLLPDPDGERYGKSENDEMSGRAQQNINNTETN